MQEGLHSIVRPLYNSAMQAKTQYTKTASKRSGRKAQPTPQVEHHQCEVAGCTLSGEYRAPRQRSVRDDDTPSRFHLFCLEHVREYNKQWDFFRGMSSEEIDQFRKDALGGHRPTWQRGMHLQSDTERLRAAIGAFLSGEKQAQGMDISLPPPPKHLAKALQLLEVTHPASVRDIKQGFKRLVKLTHPDLNPNDVAAEARFKELNNAYHVLLKEYVYEKER